MEDTTPLSKPDTDSPALPNFTFGVEIEFAVATLALSKIDPEPFDGRNIDLIPPGTDHFRGRPHVVEHIRGTLSAAGIRVDVGTDFERSANLSSPGHTLGKAWALSNDISIKAPEGDRYEWASIELQSPPFYYTRDALREVETVCDILRSTYRVSCNPSCGLHVHVGREQNGFAVQTIRNFLATVWTFEPHFDTFHPPHRREDMEMLGSLRGKSYLARNCMAGGRRDPSRGLEELFDPLVDSMDGFRELMMTPAKCFSSEGKLRYSLGDVGAEEEVSNTSKRTIEIRQHKSTLLPEEVTNWIRFCVQLVRFSDEVDPDTLKQWLTEHIDQTPEEYPLGAVLKRLGMRYLGTWYTWKIARDEEERKARKEADAKKAGNGQMCFDESKLFMIFPGMSDWGFDEEIIEPVD